MHNKRSRNMHIVPSSLFLSFKLDVIIETLHKLRQRTVGNYKFIPRASTRGIDL